VFCDNNIAHGSACKSEVVSFIYSKSSLRRLLFANTF